MTQKGESRQGAALSVRCVSPVGHPFAAAGYIASARTRRQKNNFGELLVLFLRNLQRGELCKANQGLRPRRTAPASLRSSRGTLGRMAGKGSSSISTVARRSRTSTLPTVAPTSPRVGCSLGASPRDARMAKSPPCPMFPAFCSFLRGMWACMSAVAMPWKPVGSTTELSRPRSRTGLGRIGRTCLNPCSNTTPWVA